MRYTTAVIASVLVLIAALPSGATVTASANPVGAATVYSYIYANTDIYAHTDIDAHSHSLPTVYARPVCQHR